MRAFALRSGLLFVAASMAVTPGCQCDRAARGDVVLVREGTPGRDNVRLLAGGADHVFYVEGEHGLGFRLKRLPRSGGPMFQLAEVQKAIRAVQPAGETTYFATEGAVYRVPSRGGVATRVFEAKDVCAGKLGCGLVASGDDLFVTTPSGILRIPTQGGVPQEMVTGLGGPGDSVIALAADGGHLYWLHQVIDGVFRVRRAGGAVEQIVSGVPEGRAPTLVVSGGSVFYLAANQVFRAPATGGEAVALASTGSHTESYSGSFAVMRDMVYFARTTAGSRANPAGATRTGPATGDPEGGVMKVPVAGGEPVWVARGFHRIHSLTVDDDALHFAADDGQVIRHPL